MKILHIITGLTVGGAEIALRRLIESHHDNPDYSHSVVSLKETGKIGQQLQALGIKVQALGMRSFLDVPRAILQLVAIQKRFSPDIVQAWMYHADLLGGIASRIAGNRLIIWGVYSTDINPYSRATRVVRRLCVWLSHWLPHTICYDSEAARKSHVALGYDATRMEVVPNGLDMSWSVSKSHRQDLRARLGYQQNDLVIGTVGRFDYVKHHENFVRAAGILIDKYSHLYFLMVGRDLDASNSDLASWISETGHGSRFILLGERSDIPVCLSAMDIFCLSSRTESFAIALGEAMVMGLPCVTTNVGDAGLMLGGGEVVVPKENAKALAAGLEKLLALTPDERVSLGQQNRQRIHDTRTMSHTRERYEAIYNEMMN